MRILFLLFSLSFTQLLFSQNEQVVVTDILIEGNKKTKEKTILRELDFAFGDTIPTIDLISRLRRSEELLLHTGLFTLVRINIKIWKTLRKVDCIMFSRKPRHDRKNASTRIGELGSEEWI